MDIEEYAARSPHYYKMDVPPLLKDLLAKETWRTFLDCGCGDGSLLYALDASGMLRGKNVMAVDLSESRVERVRTINPRFSCRVDSAETLSTVDSDSVDVLVSTQVIEHVDDGKMLSTLARVVRHGGTIYLSTIFKKAYGWYFYRNAAGRRVIDPTHVREYTDEQQLLQFLDSRGLRLVAERKRVIMFSILELACRALGIHDQRLLAGRAMRWVRRISLPIPGYYIWELVLRRI